jgi:chaperone BCS1
MAPRVSDVTIRVESTSHEYPILSWWAAKFSDAVDLELLKEEVDHMPVWGLACDAPEVTGRWGKWTFAARAVRCGAPVGLAEISDQHKQLWVRVGTLGIDAATLMMGASEEYEKHFGKPGLKIYYTRKMYESVRWELFGTFPWRPISSVTLAGGLHEELLADARRFISERAVYERLGRPYKRVYCLHGPPGTGKTSVISAIASELRKPLAIFNVDSLRDDTFIELISKLPSGAVMMFEDVDALFKGRAEAGGGMTFSTLLNTLDGVLHPSGALIFLTTNHLEKLDSALHRPGRVDRLVEVGYATREQLSALWRAVFPRAAEPAALLNGANKVTPAWASAMLFSLRDESAAAAERRIEAELSGATKPRPSKQSARAKAQRLKLG